MATCNECGGRYGLLGLDRTAIFSFKCPSCREDDRDNRKNSYGCLGGRANNRADDEDIDPHESWSDDD